MMVVSFSITFLSFLLAAAAQTSSQSPLIPPDVSQGCQDSLASLDADTNLQGCLQGLISATSSVQSMGSSPSAGSLSSVLDSLCSAQSSCSATNMRQAITSFGVACADDFDNSGQASALYDLLYSMGPLAQTLCLKDSGTGDYCALQAGTTGNDSLDLSGYTAQTFAGTGVSQAGNANLEFLFVSASSPSGVLCSSCFQNVMQTYVVFENDVPYERGVDQSPMLHNQMSIWTAFQNACGSAAAGDVAINAGAAPQTGAASARPAAAHPAAAAALLLLGALALL